MGFVYTDRISLSKIQLSLVKYMRFLYLDVARSIALLLIVITHVKERLFSYCWPYNFDSSTISYFLYTIDRMGVPIFFFISGALMITKNIKSNYQFYWKRVFIFIFLAAIYTVLTNFIGYRFLGLNGATPNTPPETQKIIDSLYLAITQNNFIYSGVDNNYAGHIWFMFSIINLYLFLPYISIFVNACSNKILYSFIAINLIIFFIPGSFVYQRDGVIHNLSIFSNVYKEFGGIYLCYFISGYLIHKEICFYSDIKKNVCLIDINFFTKKFSKLYKIINIKTCSIFLIIGVALHNAIFYINRDIAWNSTWYSKSAFIFINSLLLYLIIILMSNKFLRFYNFFGFISKVSFGVYLVHYAVLLLILHKLIKLQIVNHNNFIIVFIGTYMMTLLFSVIFVYCMFKIPKMKFLVS